MKSSIFLFFLSLFIAGCSGKIEGFIFLDTNGNQLADPRERTLGNVALKVTYDGASVGKSRTSASGTFTWPIRESGYYCVEIDEPTLSQSILAQMASGRLPVRSVASSRPNVNVGPPVQNIAHQIVASANDEEDKKEEEKKEEKDEETETETPKVTEPDKRDFGLVCKNTEGGNLKMDIPFVIDYSADIDQMPPPLKQTHRLGEEFQINIPNILGCNLKPLFVPDALQAFWPVDPNQVDPNILKIDPDIGRVDFKEGITDTSVSLHLKAKETIPFGTYTVPPIEPKVTCPGDPEIPLNAFEIEIIATPSVKIQQTLPGSTRAGGRMNWRIAVENKMGRELSLKLTGVVPTAGVTLRNAGGGDCHMNGNQVECDLILGPARTQTIVVEVNIPDFERETAIQFQSFGKIEGYEPQVEPQATEVLVTPNEEEE